MHRWTASAAGGMSQRLKPGLATMRSRARKLGTATDGPPGRGWDAAGWPQPDCDVGRIRGHATAASPYPRVGTAGTHGRVTVSFPGTTICRATATAGGSIQDDVTRGGGDARHGALRDAAGTVEGCLAVTDG